MRKEKYYLETRFSSEVLKEAIDAMTKLANCEFRTPVLYIKHDDSTLHYDEVAEFLADFRKSNDDAQCIYSSEKFSMQLYFSPRKSFIGVEAKTRVEIETIFSIFEKHANSAKLTPLPMPPAVRPVVFIGHGRNVAWRDLKDHLQDKHGYKIEAYETGNRAGHTIRDILEDMALKSSFAILVLTAEDEQADGNIRARQNVIHEAGLFQGRLGFPRAILLMEEGTENFSNVQGVQYLQFSKNNIKEVFGDVLATLKREFPE